MNTQRPSALNEILCGEWSDARLAEVEKKFGKRFVTESTPGDIDFRKLQDQMIRGVASASPRVSKIVKSINDSWQIP